MTAILPPHLLKNFAPRPPLPFFPPLDSLDHKPVKISGVAQYLALSKNHDRDTPQTETIYQRKERIKAAKEEISKNFISEQLKKWDPQAIPSATPDPYKTLFVSRLSYSSTELSLRREFEKYGKIDKVVLIRDKTGKSRGYGFIQYTNEGDLKTAYKLADGVKINGRRICVDVERGRTVKDWKPRRLGGGLGGTRVGGPDKNQLYSGRDTGKRGRSEDTREMEEPRRQEDRRDDRRDSRGAGRDYRGVGGRDSRRISGIGRFEPRRDDRYDDRRDDRRIDDRGRYEQQSRRDGFRSGGDGRFDGRRDDRGPGRRDDGRRY